MSLRAASLLLICLVPGAVDATELPPGFVETDVISGSSIWGIRSFDWSPDGVLWIAQNDGIQGNKIWALREGGLTLALDFGWFPQGDSGFTTLAVDPDYGTNGHVWVYYTFQQEPFHNRLSRFTSVDDALTDELVVVSGPAVQGEIHYGGCLAFAGDGTLFLAIGDDFQGAATAQNPYDLRGSILHIDRSGAPAADNPWPDGSGGDPRVWATGLRSPFRCAVQPDTDALFVGDVGSSQFEELNVGVPGANFGWPTTEGPNPPGVAGLTYPVYSYPGSATAGSGACIILGAFAEAGDLDPQYEGSLFFADRIRREIYRMQFEDGQTPVSTEVWATIDSAHMTQLAIGPDGALYYSSGGSIQNIRRVEYVGGTNRQPTAMATAIPDSGPSSLDVTLDGSASSDPDGDTLSYTWDPGHGPAGISGSVIQHTYPRGVFEARLTVDDGNGLTDDAAAVRIVSGNERPAATITAPVTGSSYVGGQTISFGGSGTDPEEGAVPCGQHAWQVSFHHNDHTHPFLGPIQGICAGSFVVPDRGETASDVWYVIRQTVSDSGDPIGADAVLSAADAVAIYPVVVPLTLASQPLPDLTLSLDTAPVVAPHVQDAVAGMIRPIGALDDQLRDGHTYRWVSWSDGGSRDHEIVVPTAPATLTAHFGCDVLVEASGLQVSRDATTGELSLAWDPVADPCLAAGTRYRIYAGQQAIPSSPPGGFPVDPPFAPVGETASASFTFVPSASDRFFVVVAIGSDLAEGPVGHYGF